MPPHRPYTPEEGQWVQVHYNLHRGDLAICGRNRRVLGYATRILLRDAVFWVSEASRQRCIRQKKRNVHARVRGILIREYEIGPDWRRVRYCPFTAGHFFYADTEEPIYQAPLAAIDCSRIYVPE